MTCAYCYKVIDPTGDGWGFYDVEAKTVHYHTECFQIFEDVAVA